MAGYGFRLYTVKLVSGYQKSKAIDFDKCGPSGDQHVSVWVRRVLAHLESFKPLTGPPVLVHAVDETHADMAPIEEYVREPTRGQYRTKFVEHTKTPLTRIRFTIQYGRTGKVELGLQDDGALALSHIPTGDKYRGVLYLPATGQRGLLALESVPNAPNPQRMINRWLARAALDLQAGDLEAVEKLTPEEQAKVKPMPFKLNFNQYPNLERIEKAVANSPAAKVVLRKDTIDGGGTQSDDEIVLSSTLGQAKRKQAATIAGTMYRKVAGKLADGEQPVTIDDLEDLVEGTLDGIEWTEGYIQVEDETGLKKIGLEHIDKFFVYPLGASSPLSDKKFEQKVALEVSGLQSTLGIDLDFS